MTTYIKSSRWACYIYSNFIYQSYIKKGIKNLNSIFLKTNKLPFSGKRKQCVVCAEKAVKQQQGPAPLKPHGQAHFLTCVRSL